MLEDIKKDAVERMQKCVVAFRNELKRLRTGRAHPSLLEHIRVEYYGNEVPLNQVANVALEDARTHHRHAVGEDHGAGDREGDHEIRSRPDAEHRRHGDSRADAAAHRRAPSRSRPRSCATKRKTRASRFATCVAT